MHSVLPDVSPRETAGISAGMNHGLIFGLIAGQNIKINVMKKSSGQNRGLN